VQTRENLDADDDGDDQHVFVDPDADILDHRLLRLEASRAPQQIQV
jgi:hypothetical protein